MRRFFLESTKWVEAGKICTLSKEESYHGLSVLRLKIGDDVEVFDGYGNKAYAKIVGIKNGNIVIEIYSILKLPRHSPEISVLQAIIKPQRMDWLIEKLVELGCHIVQPVKCFRSICFSESSFRNRLQRWRKISISAAKQSGSEWLPEIREPLEFTRAVECFNDRSIKFIAELAEGNPSLLTRLLFLKNEDIKNIVIVIGPEGDFTSEELTIAHKEGYLPVRLGDFILRSETATLYAVSVCKAFADLKSDNVVLDKK